MKNILMILQVGILAAGCCHPAASLDPSSASVEELFEKVARDCERSEAARPGPITVASGTYYILPTSVDAVLARGTNALPALYRLRRSRPPRTEWAAVCITLIRVRGGYEKFDEVTRRGVPMASYGWNPFAEPPVAP